MGLTGLANFQLLKDFPLDLAVSDLRGEVRTFRELYEWPAHRQPAVAKIWLAVSNSRFARRSRVRGTYNANTITPTLQLSTTLS